MTDRPLIFSAPMVRAIIDGRKTQTRRVLKPQPEEGGFWRDKPRPQNSGFSQSHWDRLYTGVLPDGTRCVQSPLWQPGDRAWVREAHSIHQTHGQHRDDGQRWGPWSGLPTRVSPDGTQIAYYREGFDRCGPGRWRSPIHMPRWASRITLTITDVRVQRLQEITRGDAMSEGCPFPNMADGESPKDWFRDTWATIQGPGSWDANPWVCALTFTVEKGNIDD